MHFGRSILRGNGETTSVVTRSCITADDIDSSMQKDIDMKQQYRFENLPEPTKYFDSVNILYVRLKNHGYVPVHELYIASIVLVCEPIKIVVLVEVLSLTALAFL